MNFSRKDFIGYDDASRAERVLREYLPDIINLDLETDAQGIVERCTKVDELDIELSRIVTARENRAPTDMKSVGLFDQ